MQSLFFLCFPPGTRFLFHSWARANEVTHAGYLVKENKDNGLELARANSAVLSGLAVSRIVATSGRAPVPWALGATGALATWYYQKKIWEYEYGV